MPHYLELLRSRLPGRFKLLRGIDMGNLLDSGSDRTVSVESMSFDGYYYLWSSPQYRITRLADRRTLDRNRSAWASSGC
jgi:hypothetical protein